MGPCDRRASVDPRAILDRSGRSVGRDFEEMTAVDDSEHGSADGRALIGTAGWSLPRTEHENFPGSGSHLERYASRFRATEINSSFHRTHRRTTWERWRDSVPDTFRFSVKVPKSITHAGRLFGTASLMDSFFDEASVLGDKLACLLVQLPPSLAFDEETVGTFLADLRRRSAIAVACEPRHESWFGPDAAALLAEFHVGRVAADPARVPEAAEPGGWGGLSYFRLHGSPRVYYSAYSPEFVSQLARKIGNECDQGREVWCIFDNTTLGAATPNALSLVDELAGAYRF